MLFRVLVVSYLALSVAFQSIQKHITHNKLFERNIFKNPSVLIGNANKKHNQNTLVSSWLVLYAKDEDEDKDPSAFDQVASMGLAGILAITAAEAIFWALGVPLAALYYKVTSGEWIDMTTTDGQLKAAGFSFGYGGFATVILQYRVTLFAIPLVPFMQKYVVEPGKKIWGEKFGEKEQ